RLRADEPVLGRGQVSCESDEAPTGIRRGVAEPGRSACSSRGPRGSPEVPRTGPLDFTDGRGLESSHREDVDLRAGRGGCTRLDAFRGLEALADAANEISIAVPLEHLDQ